MAESEQHMVLVRELYFWVCNNYFNGDTGAVYVEMPDVPKNSKPPMLSSGVRPDLLAIRSLDKLLIVGEAKTSGDLETRHSIMQYKYYIDECEAHSGPAIIVMAVPWSFHRAIRNILLSLLKKRGATKTSIQVIDRLPG